MDTVSMGVTPIAFSISACVRLDRALFRLAGRTSKTIQTELVYPSQSVWVLPIVLDDVDIVRGGEQTGKRRRFGIPERRRDNACGCVSEFRNSKQADWARPFWFNMFKLFFTNRDVSKMMRRKLRGSTS
jgi:hypothetical protein